MNYTYYARTRVLSLKNMLPQKRKPEEMSYRRCTINCGTQAMGHLYPDDDKRKKEDDEHKLQTKGRIP